MHLRTWLRNIHADHVKIIVNAVELVSRRGFQSIRCTHVSIGILSGVLAAQCDEKVSVVVPVVTANEFELSVLL